MNVAVVNPYPLRAARLAALLEKDEKKAKSEPKKTYEVHSAPEQLTANQEEFCRTYIIMGDKVDAYQKVYAENQLSRAHHKATSLLARPEVAEFVSKLRGKGPDLPSEETLILQKLLSEAKSGKLSHLDRGRCMDLYIKTKKALDLGDTDATDLPASIDQAIADIKAGSL